MGKQTANLIVRKNRIVILEELNFLWDSPELKDIAKLWNQGESIKEISKAARRDPDEIILALIHLAREEKIKKGKEGCFNAEREDMETRGTGLS